MTDLTKLSDDDLVQAQIDISTRRAKAEAGFKAEAAAVQEERNRRWVDQQVASLSPEIVAALQAKTVVVEED